MVVVALGSADAVAEGAQLGLVGEVLLHVLEPAFLLARGFHRHLLEVCQPFLEVGQLAPPLLRRLASLELSEAALHQQLRLCQVTVAEQVEGHVVVGRELRLHHHVLAHGGFVDDADIHLGVFEDDAVADLVDAPAAGSAHKLGQLA